MRERYRESISIVADFGGSVTFDYGWRINGTESPG
jgi:hypothetical protein